MASTEVETVPSESRGQAYLISLVFHSSAVTSTSKTSVHPSSLRSKQPACIVNFPEDRRSSLELEDTELSSLLESVLSTRLTSCLCGSLCCVPGGSCPALSSASVQPKGRRPRSQHSWQQMCGSYKPRGAQVQEVPSRAS